jgi:signal transduction histidine kinase/ActR/RegA family two-component response regulator
VSEWSFQRKLITGVIGICLLAILTSVASLITSQALIANMTSVVSSESAELAEARALQLAGVHYIADARACLLTGGRDYTDVTHADNIALRDRASGLRARTAEPQVRALLDEVAAAQRSHQEGFVGALAALGTPRARTAILDAESVVLRATRLDHALGAFVSYAESVRLRSLVPARAAVHRTEVLLNVVTTVTVVLLALLCSLLIGVLNRSYRRQTTARVEAESGQTEARATLSEVEAASHLKDEFLATVSHELRNPLAPILTWTQLLRAGSLDAEKTRRALEVIERNVLSQAQLIDDLVDVSRVASGKFRLDVRPIDLLPAIRAAAEAQMPASDAKHIRLQLVLDERAGLISGDSERIQQVMANLISNAIKFTPKGGRVQVVLQRAESHVEISVSDSGIGIDPGFLPHVFEPFQQGTGGSMRRHGGLGLGLSIVRHIVELHGGEIRAHSEGSNLGSRFTVQFPLLATAREAHEPPRRHPIARDTLSDARLARLDGVRLLIVEDEPSAIEALLVLFHSCGADARGAGSAPEALAVLDGWLPNVIVSDIAMPGEDGYSLIRKIRLRTPERGGLIPAVALTAYAKIEDRVTILGAGFQMYLSKPSDPNELVAVVSSLANRRALGEPPGV